MSARPKYDPSDVPIPTSRPLQPSATTVRRAKTLVRPERTVAPVPLINAQAAHIPTGSQATTPDGPPLDAWRIFSRIVSVWAPDFLLESLGGLRDKQKRQAWREKIALCFIIMVLCGIMGFLTVGFQKVLCPDTVQVVGKFAPKGSVGGVLGVQGWQMNITKFPTAQGINFTDLLQSPGQDITTLFQRNASQYSACTGLSFRAAAEAPCPQVANCSLGKLDATTFQKDGFINTTLLVGYDWDQVAALQNYFVIDGAVLNMNSYMALHPTPIPSDSVDAAIRTVLQNMPGASGRDATRLFYYRSELRDAAPCLIQRYYAGNIDKVTPGCAVSQLVLYAGLIVVLSLVMVRFAMACIFNWFMSSRLAGPPDSLTLNRSAISPAVMPEGANVSIDNPNGTAPWAGPGGAKRLMKPTGKGARSMVSSSSTLVTNRDSGAAAPVMSLAQIGAELFAVCLVTCYSEGEESLRTTLDSISLTSYTDQRKLLFVIADGMITGAGEKRSTPDTCVSLLEADPRFGNPVPMSYAAVGSGSKSENRAMVYAGHYIVAGRRTPTVIVVKCGTEKEAATEKKPGNRGKRDSQLILMNFFSRVTYNDRMSPLDFDLFRKIHVLMGVTPDFFEVCLMVDADTKVYPDSLKYLVNCMHHDQMIMGVCGETRIANKRQSWVTAIQVFEYFISHHNAKAFESVFGGVSCLPGCFSMFRLKARKSSGDDWVPLIIKPEIVKEYSQSVVTTLHEKNLLLLGEDRFLTTVLLRTFPNRKMMFLPQAKCRTVVPDTFSVLLSQRRRWINSTIHNLMELVLVRNLCGTFCFSMQFVVVLPIAISLTYMLIVGMVLAPPHNFEEAIPLVLLIAVLGLPAVLILITTRKVVYIFWMLIYLAALPVWNFVLPVYAFWHFDDFSWGETRKVEGERKGEAHGEGVAVVGAASVPMRRWEDWERSRLRKIRREERRRREFERAHGAYIGSNGELTARSEVFSQYDGSDTVSVTSSDDDHWGAQIGGYNENSTQYPPPPVGLMPHALGSAETVASSDLEAMLEAGFDERTSPARTRGHETRYQLSDRGNGYTPLSRSTSPGSTTPTTTAPLLQPLSPSTPGGVGAVSSGVGGEWKTHAKKRSGGRSGRPAYGPLGPLDPGSRF
ncbi:glycosyltransferase family 2 protein [Ganoderma leucocontextum]|nr:glycosyltransferase family 2 protein [Ganoderma leucocontextum]